VLAEDVLEFALASLLPPPARVLEVGAGAGELARELRRAGYEVVAVDPASESPDVLALPLLELEEETAAFDAALAVVSLHHVEPLEPSCRHLGRLVRPGGVLVVDEFDVESFDRRAAEWWLAHREDAGEHAHEGPDELGADLRGHLHSVATITGTLDEWFELSAPVRGPYLHRWDLPAGMLDAENELIAAGSIPATGARLVGTRR
jgi:SAM-dependent methyltransferase